MWHTISLCLHKAGEPCLQCACTHVLQRLQGSQRQRGPRTDGLRHGVKACERIIYVTDRISVRKHFRFHVRQICALPRVPVMCQADAAPAYVCCHIMKCSSFDSLPILQCKGARKKNVCGQGEQSLAILCSFSLFLQQDVNLAINFIFVFSNESRLNTPLTFV